MQQETLVLQSNRLFRNYCPELSTKAREEKMELLRSELINYSDKAMIYATEAILQDENIKKFPIIAQFKNYLRIKQDCKIEAKACPACEGTGYFNIWQLREELNKYYSFAFRCSCDLGSQNRELPILDERAIPKRAHNPYPPTDSRHDSFNLRNSEFGNFNSIPSQNSTDEF